MFGLGIWELLLILAVVVLIFGTKKLSTLGADLGNAIKGFRSALSSNNEEVKADPTATANSKVIDGEVERHK